MKREIVETGDGSHSLYVPDLDEHYHSRHGALQESLHVFIEMGWKAVVEGKDRLRVLEIGFGTGLNALLTVLAAEEVGIAVEYTGIEAYPLADVEVAGLNYVVLLGPEAAGCWQALHQGAWEEWVTIAPHLTLCKRMAKIENFELAAPVDLIYFDAFAPNKQPELWTEEIFRRMYAMCAPGAVLVTYCSKGDVRRAMLAAGFEVEKVPGPPGKREMLRAFVPNS